MKSEPIVLNVRAMLRTPVSERKQNLIKESLAFVSEPKQYKLDSDSLTQNSRALHIEIYKDHCERYTRLSSESAAAGAKGSYAIAQQVNSAISSERNSVWFHELFFSNCFCRNSQISISSISYARLARDFGDFDDWQRDFSSRSRDTRGAGWIVTGFDTYLRRYVNMTVSENDGSLMSGVIPVIVIDCWEHSYVCDFGKDRDRYVTSMMGEINWDVVNDRVSKADEIAKVLK